MLAHRAVLDRDTSCFANQNPKLCFKLFPFANVVDRFQTLTGKSVLRSYRFELSIKIKQSWHLC